MGHCRSKPIVLILALFLTASCAARNGAVPPAPDRTEGTVGAATGAPQEDGLTLLEKGYDLFWSNRVVEALTLFGGLTNRREHAAAAWYGVSLCHVYRGDTGKAVSAWLETVRADPESLEAFVAFSRACTEGKPAGSWEEIRSMAETLLAADVQDQGLASSATQTLAEYEDFKGRPKKADGLWSGLGFLTDFLLIGPFSNPSGSGFAKVYPPEEAVDPRQHYTGKDDREVSWVPVPERPRDGRIPVRSILSMEEDFVAYAYTAILPARSGEACLKIGSGGALQVWLNGRRVLEEDEERYFYPDAYVVRVTLVDGPNSLLVKCCNEDPEDPQGFSVRLTDLDGRPIEGLRCRRDLAPTPKSRGAGGPPAHDRPWQALTRARERAERSPSAGNLALLAWLLDLYDYDKEAYESASRALALHPDSAYLLFLQGTYASNHLDDPDLLFNALETAGNHSPELIYPYLLRAGRLRKKESYDAALEALEEALRVNPRSVEALRLRGSIRFFNTGKKAEGEADLRRAASLAPEGIWDNLGLLMVSIANGDAPRGIHDRLRRVVRMDPRTAGPFLAELCLKLQTMDLRQKVSFVEEVERLDPMNPLYPLLLATLHHAASDGKAAREALARAAELAPFHPAPHRVAADLCLLDGRVGEGLEHLNKILGLDPGDFDALEKIRSIEERPALVERVPPPDLERLLAEVPDPTLLPDAKVYWVLDERVRLVYPNRATKVYGNQVLRILTREGARSLQRFRIPYNPFRCTLQIKEDKVVKPDGSEVTGKHDRGIIFFDNLEVGDTIHIRYEIEQRALGALGRDFWDSYLLHNRAPSGLVRYVLVAPADLDYTVRLHNCEIVPETLPEDDFVVSIWSRENVPGVPFEPALPSAHAFLPWIDVSTVSSWGKVADWYRNLTEPLLEPDDEVTEKVEALTHGLASIEEKKQAILEFVTREIKYSAGYWSRSAFKPEKPRRVIRTKRGDCKDKSTLLVQMLRQIGMNAHLALVFTDKFRDVPALPSLRFPHCIVAVASPADDLEWIDPASDVVSLGDVPLPVRDSHALLITEGEQALRDTPANVADADQVRHRVVGAVDAEGLLRASTTSTYSAGFAASVRDRYADLTPADREKFLEQLVSESFPLGAAREFDLSGLERPTASVDISYAVCQPGYGQRTGDLMVLRVPFVQQFTPLAEKTRTCPRDNEHIIGVYAQSVELALPSGYAPLEKPRPIQVSGPYGSYALRMKVKAGRLVCRFDARIDHRIVPPEEYTAFRDFYQGMLRIQELQVVLRRGS